MVNCLKRIYFRVRPLMCKGVVLSTLVVKCGLRIVARLKRFNNYLFFFFFTGFSLSCGVAGMAFDFRDPCLSVCRPDCAETDVFMSLLQTSVHQFVIVRSFFFLVSLSSVLYSLSSLRPFSQYVNTISVVSL